MTTYFVSLKPGHFKVYSTPYDTFWCCTGTGVENHAKYGDSALPLTSLGYKQALQFVRGEIDRKLAVQAALLAAERRGRRKPKGPA